MLFMLFGLLISYDLKTILHSFFKKVIKDFYKLNPSLKFSSAQSLNWFVKPCFSMQVLTLQYLRNKTGSLCLHSLVKTKANVWEN